MKREYSIEIKEKNGMGMSPGHTEHVLNTTFSPVIKKTVIYPVNDYMSLIMDTPEKQSDIIMLQKCWIPTAKSFQLLPFRRISHSPCLWSCSAAMACAGSSSAFGKQSQRTIPRMLVGGSLVHSHSHSQLSQSRIAAFFPLFYIRSQFWAGSGMFIHPSLNHIPQV